MKFIKGKYEKCLRTHENIKDYKYNENDYFLQHEQNFLVTLYQVVFNNDYLTIKEIACFCTSEAKNLSCKEMKKYIMKKHTKELYESI